MQLALGPRPFWASLLSGLLVMLLQSLATAQPEPRVQIHGVVLDTITSQPVRDYKVTGNAGLTITYDAAAPGVFHTSLARPRWPYQFRIEAPGYAPFQSDRFITPDDETSITRTFRLGHGGTVIGRVIRADNHAPISGVQISSIDSQLEDGYSRVYPTCTTGTTNADGRFRLERVGAGPQILEFTPPAGNDLVSATFNTDVVHGEVTDMEDLKLGTGSILEGLLVSTPGDQPLAGEAINVNQFHVTTGLDGRFRLTNLRNGMYKVSVPARDFDSWAAVDPQETKSLTLRISSVAVNLRFFREDKPTKSSGRLARIGANQSIVKFWHTDEDGLLKLQNLAPGPWQLEGFPEDTKTPHVHQLIQVPEGGPPVDLAISYPAGVVKVKVLNTDGTAAAGASARLRKTTTATAEVIGIATDHKCDESGAYSFNGLEDGSYTLTAFGSDGQRSDSVTLQLSGREPAEVDLHLKQPLKGGTIQSTTLSYGSGKPLSVPWTYLFAADGSLWEHAAVRSEDGVMRIDGVPPGRYLAQISAFGYSVTSGTVDVRPGETVTRTDVLYQAGALKWTLLDTNGKPVVNAACTLTPATGDTIETVRRGTTNAQGEFITRGIFPGEYELVAINQGKSVKTTVTISPANLTQQSATLQ